MVTFIYILLFLALFHYLYENVLLPSIRLKFRYRLFSLRDELRRLKFENIDLVDDRLYEYLQTSLNVTINILPRIDIGMFLKVRKIYEEDKEFRSKIERRGKLMDELTEKCKVPKLVEIRENYLEIFRYVFLANVGSWSIYIVPIALLVICWNNMKTFIKNITTIREHEVDVILPSCPIAYSA